MKELVTFAIIIRDRESSRVRNVVDSVRANGADPSFIVIDYGSNDDFASQYRAVCESAGLAYERMYTQGLPWSRSHALNRGARLATTKFVVTSDVDMLYTTNPIAYCLANYSPKTMYHVDAYPIPRNGDRKKARFNGRNSGPFQFIEVRAFQESGGYDERIKYWGQEERDWVARLQALGYRQEWLPEPHRIYHQWHPISESGGRRPVTADYSTLERCAANALNPALDQDWGRGVDRNDRPILDFMERKSLSSSISRRMSSADSRASKAVPKLHRGGLRSSDAGHEMDRCPLSAIADPVAAMLRPMTALAGLSCSYKTNKNFDYFYAHAAGFAKKA